LTTASDINKALSAKYSGAEWRVWFEVSQSTGWKTGRRADCVVMNLWPSKGHQLHVFEVKVSRADFKNEMVNLDKSEAIGKYCDFFWLACPVGLVDVKEVPEKWGLIELTKGGLRIKKQAPARANPEPLTRGFAASLLRSGESLTDQEIQKRVDEKITAQVEAMREQERARNEYSRNSRQQRVDRLEKWVTEFTELFGRSVADYEPPAKMIERIKIAEQLDAGHLKRIGEQAKKFAATVDDLHRGQS